MISKYKTYKHIENFIAKFWVMYKENNSHGSDKYHSTFRFFPYLSSIIQIFCAEKSSVAECMRNLWKVFCYQVFCRPFLNELRWENFSKAYLSKVII